MDGESNYISLQEAAQSCSYSQEYLSLRARQGKLKAIKFGRNWAIKKEWLDEYLGKVEEYNHNHNNHLKTQGFSLPPENLPIEVQNVKYEGVRKYSEFSLRAPFVLALVSVLLISNIVFGKENLENVYPAIKNFSDSVFSSADIYVKGLGENTDEFFSDFSQGLKNVFEQTSSLTASFGGSFDAGAANAIENLARGANGYAYIIADAVAQNADIFLTSLEESFVSVKDDSKEVFLAIKDFPRSVFELSDFYVKEFNDKAIGYLIDSSQSFENVYFDAQSLLSKISGGLSLYASIVIKETDNFLVGVDKFFASVFKNTENISKNISGDINESLVEIKNAGAEIFRMTYGFKNGLAEAGAAAGGVMKEYFSWVEEKVSGAGQNIVEGYKDANELLEDKIGNFGITAKESLESTGRDIGQALREIPRMLTSPFKKEKSEIVVEKVPKEPEKIIEESEPKDSVSEKKETVVKEIIKEVAVEKVTKVEPIKEITKEVQKIDDKSLAQVKASIIELQEEVAKRLYAPGGVISQEIIIKEPVASPKIYQENSDIVLQAVGTGNVILSSGKGMNISGSQVIIDSTSLTNPLVYIADKTTIGGNAIIEGTASIGGAASAHRLTLNAPSDYSGKILDVQYNGTSLFSVTQAGSTALGTTTSGVWQGTVIDPVYGGTGLSSFARGDLLLATTTSAFVRLATGTESQVLTITGGIPAWAAAAGGSGQDTEWIITGSAMYATNTISSLGIGTSSPASLFELYAATTTNTQLTITVATDTTTYDPRIVFRTGSNPTARFAIGVDYSDSNKFKIATSTLGVNDIFTIDQNARIGIGTSSPATTFSIQGTSTTPIFGIFASNSTPIIYTDAGGNIGIGTTTPGAENSKVSIVGSASSDTLFIKGFTTSKWPIYVERSGAASQIFGVYETNLGRGAMAVMDENGNQDVSFTAGATAFINAIGGGSVGIGTTTPSSLLELYAATTTNTQLTITVATDTTTYDPRIVFRTGSNPTARFALGVDYSDSNKFKIATSTLGINDIFTIDQNGRIGIGTSSPATTFSIQGTSTTPIFGIFASNSTPILYAEPGAGYLGVGTTTPVQALDVRGTIQMTGFKMPNGVTNNYVLTTDASGVGTWQAAAGGADTDWIISGSTMYATSTSISSYAFGTTTPTGFLELYSATSTNTQLTITTATSTTYDPLLVFRTGEPPATRFVLGVDLSDSNKFKIATSTLGVNDIFTIDQNGRFGIGTTTPAQILAIQATGSIPALGVFASNSSPSLFINSNGDVGIGTTTPSTKLAVEGNISVGGNNWLGLGSSLARIIFDPTGEMELLSANVGIGTSSPASLLELYAATTTNTQLTITVATDTTTYDPRIVFRTGSNPATKFAIGVDYSDSNKFKIATSTLGVNDIFTIDQNARIGIGTSSPATTFSIQGTSTTPIFGIFASNSTPILYIEPGSGNIGIGTATPGALLDINGATRYRGTLTGNGDSTGNIIDARDFRRSIDTSYVTLNGGTDDLLSGYVTAYGRNYGGAESGAITITTPNAAKTGRLVRFTVGGTADTAYSYFENSLVGIGTTTPASLLEIVSATNTDAQLTITIATSTNTADPKIVFRTGNEVTRFAVGVDYSDSNKFKIATSTLGVNDIFTIDQNARIGIGTSSPATTFSIQGTSTTPIFGIFASNSTPILYIEPGSGNIGIGTTTPASLFSVATTTPIFNITRNGYIGIATSSPARRLEVLDSVNPQMRMTQSGTQYGEFQIDGAGDLTVTLSGNDLLMPDINLQVCIGACPAFTLTGNGNLIVETALYVGSDTTNYIQASSTGMMYGGTAKPKRSVILTSAGAISPTTNGASQTKVDGTNHSYYVLDFDASTDESAFWQWVMPDSYDNGTIDVTTYWEATTTSGVVIWCLQAAGITANNAEDIDASLSTALCQDDTAQANATDLASLATTSIASNFTAGEYVIFKLYRDANDAADTMTADARFVKIKIEYAVTTEGD